MEKTNWKWYEVWALEHPYKYVPVESVLDAVKQISNIYSAFVDPDVNVMPFEIPVEEFGEPIVNIMVVMRQRDRLMQLARNWGATVLDFGEAENPMDFVRVRVIGGNLEAIFRGIQQCRIITSTKIRMTSKVENRMVSKAHAYDRDFMYYNQINLWRGTNRKTGEPVEKVEYNIDRMSEGAAIRAIMRLFEEQGKMVIKNQVLLQQPNGAAKLVDHATDLFVTISANMRSDEMKPIVDKILERCYIMRSSGLTNGIAVGYEIEDAEGHKYVTFFGPGSKSGKPLPIEQIEVGMKNGTVLRYEPFFESPSMIRTQTILMINTTNVSRDELINIINEASYGAYDIMREAYGDKPMGAEKALKKIGRLSLMMTGSSNFGTVDNFAVFIGELSAFGVVWHDGWALVSAQYIQRALLKKGVRLTLEECYNLCGQARIATIKGLNTVEDERWIQTVKDDLKDRGIIKGVVHINPKTMSREEIIRIAVDIERNENHKYDGFLMVYGDENHLDYFGDSTNMKCLFDMSRPLEYCLMDIPVKPKGHALTSRQICNVMQNCPEFLPIVLELGKETVDHIISDKFDVDDQVFDEEAGEIRHFDIGNNEYATNVLNQIFPNIGTMDNNIRRTQWRGRIDAVNRVANRFNIRVRGANFKIIGDMAGWFGARLLEENEVFSPGFPMTDVTVGLAFRHPLCGRGEHLVVKFVTKDVLFARVDNLKREDGSDLPEHCKLAIKGMINAIMPGICMLASTYGYITAYFSGADFDGDSITVIWEKAFLEMAAKMPLYYVQFGGHNAADKEFKFGYDLIPNSLRYQYGIGGGTVNPSIGRLAGYNVTVLSLLYMVSIWDEDNPTRGIDPIYVRNLFRDKVEHFVYDRIKGNYKRSYRGNADFTGKEKTYAEDFEKAVAKAGNSKEEVMDILKDLNVIISKCMNDVIDAAKTADKVHVPFMEIVESRVRSGVVAVNDYGKIELMPGDKLALKPLQSSIIGTKGVLKNNDPEMKWFKCAVKAEPSMDGNGRVLVFEDVLTQLRNGILEYAYDKITEALQESVKDAFGPYKTQDERLGNTLAFLSSQYIDVMRSTSGDRKTMKKVIASMARKIVGMSSVSNQWLIQEMRAASWYTNRKSGEVESNGFYLAFVSELVRYFVNKYCPNKVFENRVYKYGKGWAEVGQELTFEKGFTKDGFYAESPIDGTYKLEVNEEGRAIIRKPVTDMIPEIEDDDRIIIELNNDAKINGIPCYTEVNPTKDKPSLINAIEQARARKGGSVFCFKNVNIHSGLVVNDLKDCALTLVANGKPLAGVHIPFDKATYFASMLVHKTISIEQVEVCARNGEKAVFIIGRLSKTANMKKAA